jgi:MFS family permease
MAQRPHLHATVRATGWVSFFTDLSSEMIYPLLPLFLVGALHAGMPFVGVVEGLAETTASLLKLLSGSWSDRCRARRPFVLVGYCLSSFSRPLMALATAPWHVLAMRVSDRVGKGLRGAPRDALIADVTPPDQRGRAFGYQRAMDHAGAALGPLVAFGLLHGLHWELRWIFGLAALPGLLAALAIVGWVHDPPRHDQDEVAPTPFVRASWRTLDARLLRVIAIIALFTLGNSSDAFLILRARALGVPMAWVPILWVALHLVKTVTSTPGGALSDRVGRKRLIVGGWLVYALVYLGFGLAHSAWQVWALFAVYGVYFGLTEGTEKALVADLAGKERKGAAFGVYTFAVGVAALPASVLMGVVWELVGPLAAFGCGGALALAASALLWRCVPESAPQSAT